MADKLLGEHEVIKGSDHQIKVRFSTKISLPKKSEKERQELEQMLQDLGKWDEVSTLDTFALEKVIKEDNWDKELVEKIQAYYQEEEKRSVSLSRLKEE